MNIQTISIVVPTKGCVNHCPFCVSRMHENNYELNFDEFQMTKRIKWAVMNGINTCIITGTGEALQNRNFLLKLSDLFEKMGHPFPNVELQTTGVLLNEQALVGQPHKVYINIELLKRLGVNTVSLSVSNIFDDLSNAGTIGISEKLKFNLQSLINLLKANKFNIRLSLNMINVYDNIETKDIFNRCSELGADQVTFRKMYAGNDDSEQSKWIKKYSCKPITLCHINNHIISEKFLYTLPFGGRVYSVNGMSVVLDNDCMSKDNAEALKYVILREDGRLYSQWDDNGSLIF